MQIYFNRNVGDLDESEHDYDYWLCTFMYIWTIFVFVFVVLLKIWWCVCIRSTIYIHLLTGYHHWLVVTKFNPNLRYSAVDKPVEYSRMARDASSHSRRLATYIVPITLLSILFNLPKFFESRVSHVETQRMLLIWCQFNMLKNRTFTDDLGFSILDFFS